MEGYNGFYLLQPISNFTGIQLDQINFIFVQLFGLVFGHVFRKQLSCSAIGVKGRHLIELAIGFGMLYFCFGSHAFYLLFQTVLSYIIILALPQTCGLLSLVASMVVLGVFHYERMHHNPLTYVSVNISGPLMINTQRITSLAFGIADGWARKHTPNPKPKTIVLSKAYDNNVKINGGIKVNGIGNGSALINDHNKNNNTNNNHNNTNNNHNNINNNHNNTHNKINNDIHISSNNNIDYDKNNNNNNKYNNVKNIEKNDDQGDFITSKTINEVPDLLSVLSYTYSFHAVLCGPFSYYHDYDNFINERITKEKLHKDKRVDVSFKNLNPQKTIIANMVSVVVLIALSLKLTEYSNLDRLMEINESKQMGFVYLATYVLIVSHVGKFKYFIAWKLAEAVSCSAGFGFNGWDENGHEKWDLNNNIDMIDVERATTLQMVFRHWNKTTSSWLRYIVYERTRSTYLVFALSALWHGFYPGYYISFIGGAFFISVSKMARKLIRPYFVSDNQLKNSNASQSKLAIFYDIITIIITKIQLAYLSIAFFLLDFHKSFDFYSNFYFCIHIINIVAFVVLIYCINSRPSKK